MIDSFPLSFFLPLVVHAMAGLFTGITGLGAFRVSKRRGWHEWWGTRYLWAYTIVFLTATILSAERWEVDADLFFLALGGYGAWCFRQELMVKRIAGNQWIVIRVIGMIGSYVVLWTAFFVDNAHLIPLLNQLPLLTFWVLSISRFAPNMVASSRKPVREGKEETV